MYLDGVSVHEHAFKRDFVSFSFNVVFYTTEMYKV